MDIEGTSTATLGAIALLCRSNVQKNRTLRNLITAGLEGVLRSAIIAAVSVLSFTNSSEKEH